MLQNSTPYDTQDDRYAGIRVLWLKIIVRAISDLILYRGVPDLAKRRDAETASIWMFQPHVCFNGFENVCHMLDVDPDKIRARTRSLSKREAENLERAMDDIEVRNLRNKKVLGLLVGRVDDDEDY